MFVTTWMTSTLKKVGDGAHGQRKYMLYGSIYTKFWGMNTQQQTGGCQRRVGRREGRRGGGGIRKGQEEMWGSVGLVYQPGK